MKKRIELTTVELLWIINAMQHEITEMQNMPKHALLDLQIANYTQVLETLQKASRGGKTA